MSFLCTAEIAAADISFLNTMQRAGADSSRLLLRIHLFFGDVITELRKKCGIIRP